MFCMVLVIAVSWNLKICLEKECSDLLRDGFHRIDGYDEAFAHVIGSLGISLDLVFDEFQLFIELGEL